MTDGFPRVDFDEFHRIELPRRLAAGNGALAAADLPGVGALGFRIAETGSAWTYVPAGDRIEVVEGGDEARTLVTVDLDSWQGLVYELETPPSLLYSGRAECDGNPLRFVRWDPALRAMYQGRPVYDPAAVDLRDRGGEALDPAHGFTLDDDFEDMAHFLRTAGYLFVRDVFRDEEVGAMLAAAGRARDRAVEGDRKSWWGRNADGDTVLCRVTNAAHEDVLRRLYGDDRLLRLAGLSDHEVTPRAAESDEGVTVLWKNPGITEGLSDLPWHRDCGMGGHATMCPLLICTICLTDGSPEAGELRFLPGSWQASANFLDPGADGAYEGVGLPVTAGDVTLHYGDGMHASLAPTSEDGPFRVSVLVAFVSADAHYHRAEKGFYNDVLLSRDDGQVEHLADVVGRETV